MLHFGARGSGGWVHRHAIDMLHSGARGSGGWVPGERYRVERGLRALAARIARNVAEESWLVLLETPVTVLPHTLRQPVSREIVLVELAHLYVCMYACMRGCMYT